MLSEFDINCCIKALLKGGSTVEEITEVAKAEQKKLDYAERDSCFKNIVADAVQESLFEIFCTKEKKKLVEEVALTDTELEELRELFNKFYDARYE